MISDPLVSIVIPAFNGEAFISHALASVLSQSFKKLEIVVVDDASEDRTRHIVRQFDDPRIRLIENERNLGLVANLNKGIRSSNGEFVCWFNQDDIFYPRKIERQLQVMRSRPDVGACFCAKDDIDENGEPHKRFNPTDFAVPEQDQLVQLFGGCYLSAPTVMMRRQVYDLAGGFDTAYHIAFDYDMWFKIKRTHRFEIISRPLLGFRHHANNLSSERNQPRIASECASIVRKNLKACPIETVYPFLKEIGTPEKKRVETSACFLSLADLIWRQKKWNLLLVEDLLQLVGSALDLNPILIAAYRLGLEISRHAKDAEIHHLYASKEKTAAGIYSQFIEQLESAFLKGYNQLMADIIEKMYAMCPVNGDPYYQLSRLCFKSGDRSAALSYCAGAIRLNPRHGAAQQLWSAMQREIDPPTGSMQTSQGKP
jgi:glycosyltransferase involved in cell wall biosynthesis